jgi:hypothetical protein
MKKINIFLFFLLVIALQLAAQKGQPGFGKVDKADMEMKDCEFDKGADALVLIDYGNIYYDRGTVGFSVFKTVFEHRMRIKILKEKGISQADVEIPYYTHNNEEKILKINAYTYNLDAIGKIIASEVKKSAIYTKKIDGNYSKMIFSFPEVKVGSIIEYVYTIERETYNLHNWYFQSRIPVRYSEYQLKVPQIFRFSVQPSVIDPIEDKQEVIDESISMDEGYIQTKSLKSNYIMRNLPGVKNEPFMGSPKDYMQRLEFQMTQIYYSESNIVDLSLKWQDVIKNRLNKEEDFGLQLEKTVTAAKLFIEDAKQITDAETRMKFIFNHIRKSISWNGDENYVYTENGIIKTWETKTGNVADINLLLIKILNDADIKTIPILFSTRDHGLVTPYYPSINQFNTVMAYVLIKDKAFVLDATDKVINYKLVPEKVVNTNGFILEGENGKWHDILSGKGKYKVMAAVQGEIDEAGNMKGNGLVNCYDYARAQRVKEWREDNLKFKNDYFIKSYPALQIEDIAINNVDADSLPLEQKIKFSSTLNSSGEYRYFNINLFSDLEKNPFIASTRMSDIDFGVQQDYTIFGNYTIPPGYIFDGLPENISMTTSDNSIIFSRTILVESNLLNVRMTLEFKKTFYTADSYPEFKEFYKKLFDKLNEQVVIKKRTAP